MALGTDKGGGRHAAKLFEGFAEVIDIREIQGLCDLADREVFVGQKKLLGFFDAAVLAELHGRLAAVFLKETTEIALADSADGGDLGDVLVAVLLEQLDAGQNTSVLLFGGTPLLFLTKIINYFTFTSE